ncbi:hypothetical protein [[Acholeplasma] multilocale]|uniref:hypothetical protein n=1 Tax=[Acholeplasma] multilocale TaxID=264638 RepID=UPI0004788692|nr:hypothetical protein [[Acholeplasma] multilocale]
MKDNMKPVFNTKVKYGTIATLVAGIVNVLLVAIAFIVITVINKNNGNHDQVKLLREPIFEMEVTQVNNELGMVWKILITIVVTGFLFGNGWLIFLSTASLMTHDTTKTKQIMWLGFVIGLVIGIIGSVLILKSQNKTETGEI